MGRKPSVGKHLAHRAIENVRSEDGRFVTAYAVDELLILADAEPNGALIKERWTRMGAMRDIQSVPQAEASEMVASAVQQLGIHGIGLNQDISVPTAKGREYIQLDKATATELKLAGQDCVNQGHALIAKGNALIELGDIVFGLGGDWASIESLRQANLIDDASVSGITERLA